MSGHTPGPWETCGGSFVRTKVYLDDENRSCGGILVAYYFRGVSPEHPEGRNEEDCSNARLIAAAPELLSLLDEMATNCEEPPEENCSCHISAPCGSCEWSEQREMFTRARAAIAKATGKESV